MSNPLLFWSALPLVLALGGPGPAGTEPGPDGVTAKERDEAIVAAMDFLDGKVWNLNENGSPTKQYTASIAGWAYLLAADKGEKGSKRLPNRKKNVGRIAEYLSRYAESVADDYDEDDERDDDDEPSGGGFDDFQFDRRAQYVWPLGMAAHFFAEALDRGKERKEAKAGLKSIVRVLEAAQQESGGWGHDDARRPGMGLPEIPIPKPGGGNTTYPGTLLAATSCALSGLGVAHDALKSKKRPSLEPGIAYLEASQNAGGSFPYDPSQKMDRDFGGAVAGAMGSIDAARTPGCVFAMLCAGADPESDAVTRALAAVDERVEVLSEGHGSASMALQFAALLARARGDAAWARFRAEYFPRILAAQEESGAFLCACAGSGMGVTCDTKAIGGFDMPGYVEGQKVYVTAIHLLILLLDRTEPGKVPAMPGLGGPTSPGGESEAGK